MGQKRKITFSSSLLQLKFMRKVSQEIEKEKEDEDGRAIFKNNLPDEMKLNSSKYIIEPSWIACEGANVTRLSYKGMNPDIEKLMEEKSIKNNFGNSVVKEENVDVTAEEMCKIYQRSSMIKTIENKFKTKKQKNQKCGPIVKKPKFLKPSEDF